MGADEAEGHILEDTTSVSSLNGTRLGLSPMLWRLAIVVGIGQFAWSIWGWQFAIFLETIIDEIEMGLTFSIATWASIIGYSLSGIISDMIGRKKTMMLAFIPIFLGLVLLAIHPVWPFIPLYYALTTFGWSFILIIARAVPADEIAKDGGKDAARRFTMVLMPAFLVDGLSPLLAAILLTIGLGPEVLLLLGANGAILALIATKIVVKESLSEKVKDKARRGPIIPTREFGRSFWILVVGMIGFYFAFNLAIPYLGNLVTLEWNIPTPIYGLSWTAFSLTSVLLMYFISGEADKRVKTALLFSVIANAFMFWIFSVGEGIPMLILINIIWAFPIMLWIGTERALIVIDVNEEMKGRALGFYAQIMSVTTLIAAPLGAWIWQSSGSLRVLFSISGWLCILAVIPIVIVLQILKNRDVYEVVFDTDDPTQFI